MNESRTPPHSLEPERQLLGCCLIDGDSTMAICSASGVTPLTFYSPANSRIFQTLIDMVAQQKSVDVSVLAEELKASGYLEAIGGYSYLAQLSAPTTAHASYFAERIRDLQQLRDLISRAGRLIETCYDLAPREEIVPLVDGVAAVLRDRQTARTWGQAIDEAEAVTRERIKPPTQRQMGAMEISWGIADLDHKFQPIELGEVITIGGYTSVGKSSLARQIGWATSKAGHSTHIATIEVRDAEEAVNLSGHIAGLRSRARLNELHQSDQNKLLESFSTIRNTKTFSVGHEDMTLSSILSRAKAIKARRGLRILIIDYLQILLDVSMARATDKATDIGRVTSQLKRFATAEDVAVILLSGFNREYIRAGGRAPVLSDLDGSSSIEKDASRIILLDVPAEYSVGREKFTQDVTADSNDTPRFFVRATQAKGRNQGTASVGLFFKREIKTFEQITQQKEPVGETPAFL